MTMFPLPREVFSHPRLPPPGLQKQASLSHSIWPLHHTSSLTSFSPAKGCHLSHRHVVCCVSHRSFSLRLPFLQPQVLAHSPPGLGSRPNSCRMMSALAGRPAVRLQGLGVGRGLPIRAPICVRSREFTVGTQLERQTPGSGSEKEHRVCPVQLGFHVDPGFIPNACGITIN